MLPKFLKRLAAGSLCGAAVLAVANFAHGQDLSGPPLTPIGPAPVIAPAPTLPTPATAPAVTDDLKARIDRLEKQNQDLLEVLQKLQGQLPAAPPVGVGAATNTAVPSTTTSTGSDVGAIRDQVQSMVAEYLQGQADKKPAAPDPGKTPDGGFVVGKNLGLSASWSGHQPWLETSDKSFRVHFGGRTQMDWVGTGAPTNVKNGTGGIGAFKNGIEFRRARLEMDGWLWENIDFFCEYDFVNTFNFNTEADTPGAREATVANTPVPTDLWASINYLPWLGTVRIGNFKNPIGLDHLISSRYLDFIERSNGFDVLYNRNNGFVPGIMVCNQTDNDRLTWALALTRPNNHIFTWNVGNSEYQVTQRTTWLPYYEDNGRCMMHLGLGTQYVMPDNSQAILRNRWLLRNGPAALHSTVALADLTCRSQVMIVPEFFMNLGPLSIMAEYQPVWCNQVTSFTTQLQGKTATPSQTFFGQGAYVQAMYFLTGEHRPYGKNYIHSSGPAPTRIVPHRNFFWMPGHGCPNPFSCGAWQVGARYSWYDLNDKQIAGGETHEATLGLNWFLNPNLKIQWNYDIGHRDIPGATSNGVYQGYGVRMALDW